MASKIIMIASILSLSFVAYIGILIRIHNLIESTPTGDDGELRDENASFRNLVKLSMNTIMMLAISFVSLFYLWSKDLTWGQFIGVLAWVAAVDLAFKDMGRLSIVPSIIYFASIVFVVFNGGL